MMIGEIWNWLWYGTISRWYFDVAILGILLFEMYYYMKHMNNLYKEAKNIRDQIYKIEE